jgi:hypothetical protein
MRAWEQELQITRNLEWMDLWLEEAKKVNYPGQRYFQNILERARLEAGKYAVQAGLGKEDILGSCFLRQTAWLGSEKIQDVSQGLQVGASCYFFSKWATPWGIVAFPTAWWLGSKSDFSKEPK